MLRLRFVCRSVATIAGRGTQARWMSSKRMGSVVEGRGGKESAEGREYKEKAKVLKDILNLRRKLTEDKLQYINEIFPKEPVKEVVLTPSESILDNDDLLNDLLSKQDKKKAFPKATLSMTEAKMKLDDILSENIEKNNGDVPSDSESDTESSDEYLNVDPDIEETEATNQGQKNVKSLGQPSMNVRNQEGRRASDEDDNVDGQGEVETNDGDGDDEDSNDDGDEDSDDDDSETIDHQPRRKVTDTTLSSTESDEEVLEDSISSEMDYEPGPDLKAARKKVSQEPPSYEQMIEGVDSLALPDASNFKVPLTWGQVHVVRDRARYVVGSVIEKEEPLPYTLSEGIAVIELPTTPNTSGFSYATSLRLLKTISVMTSDPTIRVLILRGFDSDPETKSDTVVFAQRSESFNQRIVTEVTSELCLRLSTITSSPFMIINCVERHCTGPSFAFNFLTDVSVSSSKAEFGFGWDSYGYYPPMGSSYVFSNMKGNNEILGWDVVMGSKISAQEARDLGIADRVVESPSDVFPTALEVARKWISVQSPESRSAFISFRFTSSEFDIKKSVGLESKDLLRALSKGNRIWGDIRVMLDMTRKFYPILTTKIEPVPRGGGRPSSKPNRKDNSNK